MCAQGPRVRGLTRSLSMEHTLRNATTPFRRRCCAARHGEFWTTWCGTNASLRGTERRGVVVRTHIPCHVEFITLPRAANMRSATLATSKPSPFGGEVHRKSISEDRCALATDRSDRTGPLVHQGITELSCRELARPACDAPPESHRWSRCASAYAIASNFEARRSSERPNAS